MGTTEEEGLERIIQSIQAIHARTEGFKTAILLETTAGQGSCLGYRFEHFRTILEGVREPERLGICLDTNHIFAAGYDIRRTKTYQRTVERFDQLIGLERLKAIHLNDSKTPLGSRVDRHEHIGRGAIGTEAFGFFMKDKRLAGIPKILETPKKSAAEDIANLNILRGLLKKSGG